jgi:hypothetical protein
VNPLSRAFPVSIRQDLGGKMASAILEPKDMLRRQQLLFNPAMFRSALSIVYTFIGAAAIAQCRRNLDAASSATNHSTREGLPEGAIAACPVKAIGDNAASRSRRRRPAASGSSGAPKGRSSTMSSVAIKDWRHFLLADDDLAVVNELWEPILSCFNYSLECK